MRKFATMRIATGEYTNAKKAGLGRKLIAGSIDFATPLVVLATSVTVGQYVLQVLGVPLSIGLRGKWHIGTSGLILLALPLLYIAFEVWRTNGYTLGKRLLHIRVVSLRGKRIGIFQALARTILAVLGMPVFAISHLAVSKSGKTTSLHDLICRTLELKEIVHTEELRLDHGVMVAESEAHSLAAPEVVA